MTRKRGWIDVAREWRAGRHGRFQELSALAVTGNLGGPEMAELSEHLASCDLCRRHLEEITQAGTQVMSTLAQSSLGEMETPPAGMRARFLARLGAQTQRSEHISLMVVPAAEELPRRPQLRDGGSRAMRDNEHARWGPVSACAAAAMAACAIVGLASYRVGRQSLEKSPIEHITASSAKPIAPVAAAASPVSLPVPDVARLAELESEKSAIEGEVERLTAALAEARAERAALGTQLADAQARLADLSVQVSASRQARDSSSLQEPRGQLSALQAQIDTLTLKLADADARAAAEQRLNEDITAKMAMTEADLHRERELQSARLEVSDLVAARNLHIVDVYDSDGKGKRQQAFGRVFYTEGKSLVFYAYDLQDPRRLDANVVFHVWGEKAGLKPVAHSLGLLHSDNAAEGRWAMTFDDPTVLAQINSVFVTVEGRDKRSSDPRGRKVLYAYFGSAPNHP